MKLSNAMILAGAVVAAVIPVFPSVAQIAPRPEDIHYQPLDFTPPSASDFRTELSSGVPVYLAPSSEFPLVTITFSFKGGSFLDSADKVGLARMTGAMIRRGGSETVSAEDLDEQFDFLAAQVSASSGALFSSASLNTLSANLDDAYALFLDMLIHPGFQSDKVELYRTESIERMKQRNDNAQGILRRQWAMMMFGEDHFAGRQTTINTLSNISIADLYDFQKKVFQPGNLIISVTGDFQPQQMLARLEKTLSGWERRAPIADPPAPTASFEPGVYHIEKDIPQGKVLIGQRSVMRDDPDYFPLLVMNNILGGGGFTSRIMSKVRSDEGLAYSAGSRMSMPPYYPGVFQAFFQSKNRTVALATQLIMAEIDRIRAEPVSALELATAKNSFIETFPRRFESKGATVRTFINDEWTHRDSGYWQTYRQNVASVTAADVLRVARSHLSPEDLAILVVGKWDAIQPGDLEGRASMAEFFDGKYEELPLRDPLTLKPMK